MTNRRNEIPKTIFISLLVFLLFSTVVFLGQVKAMNAYATDNKKVESKIYSNASMDDNFAEDSLLVVLSKHATYSFKTYTENDFSEFDCYEVVDLTKYTSELEKNNLLPKNLEIGVNFNLGWIMQCWLIQIISEEFCV